MENKKKKQIENKKKKQMENKKEKQMLKKDKGAQTAVKEKQEKMKGYWHKEKTKQEHYQK